jgi:4-hydroxy-tetrahydrodipicolinate synthase
MVDYPKNEAKRAARDRLTGLWAATITPFTADGMLDEAALRNDLDRLTGDLGIDGIFCGGVMSEFWALSGAERRRLVEVVADRCRGKCPVLAHTGHHSAAETIELTRHAARAGADFAVVINPYCPPASDEGLPTPATWSCLRRSATRSRSARRTDLAAAGLRTR